MEQEQQQVKEGQYEPGKYDTAPMQRVVFCPYSRCTLVLSDANGCGTRCQYFARIVPLVTNQQVPGDHGKPTTKQMKIGDKVACVFPTLRDVADVNVVVPIPVPAGVIPFPTGTHSDEAKPEDMSAGDIPPADTAANQPKL